MLILANIIVVLLGFAVGSFLNSVIYRLKFGGSIIFGRSKCSHCGHNLYFWDLIPVLSFFLLHGRCRYCHKKISFQYPLVEAATAFLFFLTFHFQFPNFQFLNLKDFINLCYLLFVVSCLVIIFVYDLKYSLILDKVIFFAAGVSLIFYLVRFFWFKVTFNLEEVFLGLIFGGGIFLILYLVSQGRWIGAGDVKLGFLMGFWLLYPKILVGLFFAFILGGVVAIILLFLGRKKMKSEIPFGPYLTVGAFVALVFGEKFLDWYVSWLGF